MIGAPPSPLRSLWLCGENTCAFTTEAQRTQRGTEEALFAIQQKFIAQPRELPQRLHPLRGPVVHVAAGFDELAVLGATGQEVDGQAVGDELVRLRAPLELVRVHVPGDLHAPEA